KGFFGGRSLRRDSFLQTHPDDHEDAGRSDRHPRNDDAVEFFELSRPFGDGFGISIRPVSRVGISARLQTRVDNEVCEAGFSRRGSAPETARRTDRRRSLLRFFGNARRQDSGGIKKSRSFAAEWTKRAGSAGNSKALQIVAGSFDLVRVDDR